MTVDATHNVYFDNWIWSITNKEERDKVIALYRTPVRTPVHKTVIITLRENIYTRPETHAALGAAIVLETKRQRRLVLVNVDNSPANEDQYRIWPHLGLLYVGTAAHEEGWDVVMWDELVQGHAKLDELVQPGDIVGLSLVVSFTERGVELARKAKQLGARYVIAGNDAAIFRARQLWVKIIVCEKADRLTRNFKDMVAIDEWLEEDEQREVHLVKDSLVLRRNARSQEKLNWGIRVLFAKNYIDNLKEEIRKGQLEKLEQGWLPQRPALGYMTIGEEKKRIHVPDPAVAPLIKQMFELYATGNYSLKKLTEVMYTKGLRTRSGKKVVKARIHGFLTNPYFYGRNVWNGEVHPVIGKHEPIVDKPLFDKVQEVLHGKNTPKYRRHFRIIKGLMRCQECSGTITWELHKGVLYGHCNSSNCSQRQLDWYKEGDQEQEVLSILKDLQIKDKSVAATIQKALLESHQDQITYYTTSVDQLTKQKAELDSAIGNTYEMVVRGRMPRDRGDRMIAGFQKEIDDIDSSLLRHSQAKKEFYLLGVCVYRLSQRSGTIWYKAKKPEQRNKLLRTVFQSFTINHKHGLKHEFTPAFKALAKAIVETNRSKAAKLAKTDPEKFEQQYNGSIEKRSRVFGTAGSVLCREWDSNPQPKK